MQQEKTSTNGEEAEFGNYGRFHEGRCRSYAGRVLLDAINSASRSYSGDNLEQLRKLPPACIDLIYIDPPFNSNGNYEVFWGETKDESGGFPGPPVIAGSSSS
ncbi:MAG: hypothetical protein ABIU29_03565 [Chthoniobacterales bacterium]